MWLVAPGLSQKRSEHTGVAFVGGSAQTCSPAVPPKAMEMWDTLLSSGLGQQVQI